MHGLSDPGLLATESDGSMPKPKPTDPRIIEMPPRKMAVVTTRGDPNVVGQTVFPALFGAVYTLKFARKKANPELDFKVTGLCARWPDLDQVPKGQWTGIWALPIPDDVTELPQKVPGMEVKIETWDYGTVAQILHIGPYSEEKPTIDRLHEFIEESGYSIAGQHEEEYLTRPDAKVVKTVIRYVVRPK